MTFYEKLGIDTYINAHDTYTIYGGSRMSQKTLEAMNQAAASFVDIAQVQQVLGAKIAKMTNNPAAYITNGAAGAITLATAVCMAKGDMYAFSKLPDTAGIANEVIVMRSQRNGYDAAIRTAGATIVEIGDADETPEFELEGAINANTAAIFYFVSSNFARASMPLEKVLAIAKQRNIPVIVDAAAQLPPVENLWKFTKMGAALALFSGGKTLCGPQDSGLIVGRADFIRDCLRFGAPNHGVCRGSKTSREAMAGLFAALEQYLALNQEDEYARLEKIARSLGLVMEQGRLETTLVPNGPVGQAYPRIFGKCTEPNRAVEIAAAMRAEKIYIGAEPWHNQIYISPLNLTEDEARHVGEVLRKILNQPMYM